MKKIITIISFLFIAGCSTQESNFISTTAPSESINQNIPTKNTIHYHIEQLAQQLFLTSQEIDLKKSVAVGTFVSADEILENQVDKLDPIGYQIQESFTTLASQAGIKVIEFKTARAIKIQKNRDLMLTREISELNTSVSVDYFLTGNYIVQENSLIVNVRIINVKNQQVIAAATDYIPADTMWSQQKSILKDGNIYRGAY